MKKNVWSVILLCVLAALLIVLCVVGVEMKILDQILTNISDETNSGTSFFAGVMGMFLFDLSATMALLFISLIGFALSCVNIFIAPNKTVKFTSLGFLIVYSIPALVVAIRVILFVLPFSLRTIL